MTTTTDRRRSTATRAKNTASIDFTAGVDPATLGQRQAATSTRSTYVKKLQELVDAIDRGDAQRGVAYKLGTYGVRESAGQIAKAIAKRDDLPPGVDFELMPVRTADGSELWVGVPDPNAELETDDVPDLPPAA